MNHKTRRIIIAILILVCIGIYLFFIMTGKIVKCQIRILTLF